MSLRLAIWDMDGTLVDSRDIIQTAMVRAFERIGLAPPSYDETRQVVGLDLAVACQALAPDGIAPDTLARLVEAYRMAFIERRAEPGFAEPLYDGAAETVKALAEEGWLLAIATGKSRRGIDAIFEMHPELKPLFDTTWCADDGPGKPSPFMCLEAMKAVGAEAGDSLIIGDAVHDMAMGRAAGLTCLGVSWGFGQAEELTAAGAHEVHHDFDSLSGSFARFGLNPAS